MGEPRHEENSTDIDNDQVRVVHAIYDARYLARQAVAH
jgi:hypothetical protein